MRAWKPASQATPHIVPSHVAAPLAGTAQGAQLAPQVATSASETHAAPQRWKPARQVNPHAPAVHVGTALATAGQTVAQPPQCRGSTCVSVQAPSHTVGDAPAQLALHAGVVPVTEQKGVVPEHATPHIPQVLALVSLGGVKNPYLDPRNIGDFMRGYLGWRGRVALNRIQRRRYQTNGTFAARGQAAPEA